MSVPDSALEDHGGLANPFTVLQESIYPPTVIALALMGES